MTPATLDEWEIAWLLIGALGTLGVLWLIWALIRELRAAYREQSSPDTFMGWVNLALAVVSLVKISICLAIGLYSAGQPPVTESLSEAAIRTRIGLIVMEILIVLPPVILLWMRRRVQDLDQEERNERAQRIREESGYAGPERRRET